MQQQQIPHISPKVPEKKSNLWLIIIIIIVLLALLWPVLRRGKTPTEPTLGEGETVTTTTDSSAGPSTVVSVVVPVSTPTPSLAPLALKVFFGNQNSNRGTWQCDMVSPVTRVVPATSAVARAALTELLNGLRPADSTAGFFTSLNSGVTIKELTIGNGVARVDFGGALITEAGANTACLKEAARAQITETLKQFPTVRTVVISVNGVLF